MRILIDGYNLMFEGGLLGKRLGPDGLRKTRQRFLNKLADALGPIDAHQTTVVFDASHAPEGVPREIRHKGLSVVFAVDTDDADERIELLIAGHSSPKQLTVVSTDRRVRTAATRRKARAVTGDAFWTEIDARKRSLSRSRTTEVPPLPVPERPVETSPEETAYWLEEFGHLDDAPETNEALHPDAPMLTDEEIARLEQEIEREFL
jgi:uncharacterized protein